MPTITLSYADVLRVNGALIGQAFNTEDFARKRPDLKFARRKADDTLNLLNSFREAAGIGERALTADWLMGEED